MDFNIVVEQYQLVDPIVTKEKFDLEISKFMQGYPYQRKRGVILLASSFPDVKVAFMAVKVKPSPLIFAVNINFSNFDLEPPSVRFIDPFSDQPLHITQLPHHFPRKLNEADKQINVQNLVLAQADGIPFFCIPGIREYHNHPAHTGDSWLLHRGNGGEGTLGFIIDKLYQYGVSAINGYQIPLTFHSVAVSFDPQSIPS